MGAYERVDEDGQVVETVVCVDGNFEDTRLGVAALEKTGGWRVVGAAPPPPAPSPVTPPPEPEQAPAREAKEGGTDGVRDTRAAGRASAPGRRTR